MLPAIDRLSSAHNPMPWMERCRKFTPVGDRELAVRVVSLTANRLGWLHSSGDLLESLRLENGVNDGSC